MTIGVPIALKRSGLTLISGTIRLLQVSRAGITGPNQTMLCV